MEQSQTQRRAGVKKHLDLASILKPPGHDNRLDVEWERKKGDRHDCKDFGPSNEKNRVVTH